MWEVVQLVLVVFETDFFYFSFFFGPIQNICVFVGFILFRKLEFTVNFFSSSSTFSCANSGILDTNSSSTNRVCREMEKSFAPLGRSGCKKLF